MNAPYTTLLPTDPRSPARPPLVAVTDGSGAPDWAETWCDRTGRRMRLHPVPGPAGGPYTPPGRVRAVAGLADGPVLLARPVRGHRRPPRIVAALSDLPDDALVIADAAEIAEQLGADLVLLHGVPLSFGERSVGLDEAVDHGRHLIEAAALRVAQAHPDLPVVPRLARAQPHELVGSDLEADLVVLGGAQAGRHRGVGPVALSALNHAPCPVLLVPRLAAG